MTVRRRSFAPLRMTRKGAQDDGKKKNDSKGVQDDGKEEDDRKRFFVEDFRP